MKSLFLIVFSCVVSISFSQNSLDTITEKVNKIDNDSTLKVSEYDLSKIAPNPPNGKWTLNVWSSGKTIYKVVEEVELPKGFVTTTIYLENETPIKIIEVENTLTLKKDGTKDTKEVFKQILFIYDWDKDSSKLLITGKRVSSESSCSTEELVSFPIEKAYQLYKSKF